MDPVYSICIPTYNRADFLDDCLSRLPNASDSPKPFEIVVSDNGSTDDTPKVLAAHSKKNPAIKAHRQPQNRSVWSNQLNAFRMSQGRFLVYLADDDSIILENLLLHVERMEREPDLAAIFTDWIAWDDDQGRELHRYFNLSEAVSFGPEDPLGLVNFVLHHMLPPEIGVYRRDALLAARPFVTLPVPFHPWMYAISRHGRVRFDPLVFYREQRIPRKGLQRGHWANMDMQLKYIGDEMRLGLESTLLMALQDVGLSRLPDDQMENGRRAIDRLLHARTSLEIERARGRGDFILATELRRRQVLWNGPGAPDDVQRDLMNLVLPAAARSVALTFESISAVKALRLAGFSSRWLHDFLAYWHPTLPIDTATAPPGEGVLVVYRDEASRASVPSSGGSDALVFEQFVRLHRVAADTVDLTSF